MKGDFKAKKQKKTLQKNVHPLKLVLWSDKKWLHTHSLSTSVV